MSGNADVAKVFDVVGGGGGGLCKSSEVGGGVGEEFSKLVAGYGEHGGIFLEDGEVRTVFVRGGNGWC